MALDKLFLPPVNFVEKKNLVDKAWFSIEAFLMATGNISKVFWPSVPGKDKNRARIERRCRALRILCEMGDDSPLKSRVLRNHFEHFDERLDIWYDADRPANLADSNFVRLEEFKEWNPGDVLRNFDPESWVLWFMGDTLEFRPLIQAVESLTRRIERPFDLVRIRASLASP